MTEHQDGRDVTETAGFSRRKFLGTTGAVGAAAAVGLRPGTAVAADAPGQPAPGPLSIGRLTTEYAERLLGTRVQRPAGGLPGRGLDLGRGGLGQRPDRVRPQCRCSV